MSSSHRFLGRQERNSIIPHKPTDFIRAGFGVFILFYFFFGARLTFLENQFPAVGFVQAPEPEGADTKPTFIPGVSIQTLIPDLSPAPTFPNPPGWVLDAPITIHGVTKIKKRGDKAK